MTVKNQIVYRDRVSIYADAAPEGATQPDYSEELARGLFAEVLQVSGGQVIRGKQVEAVVSHVVAFRYFPNSGLNAKCMVRVESGIYKGQELFVYRDHYETMHGRPHRVQLHCKTRQ